MYRADFINRKSKLYYTRDYTRQNTTASIPNEFSPFQGDFSVLYTQCINTDYMLYSVHTEHSKYTIYINKGNIGYTSLNLLFKIRIFIFQYFFSIFKIYFLQNFNFFKVFTKFHGQRRALQLFFNKPVSELCTYNYTVNLPPWFFTHWSLLFL